MKKLILLTGFVFIAATLATQIERRTMQRKAIEHGAASYQCNPTNGAVTFTWKDNQ
jgi:hypothetical protein